MDDNSRVLARDFDRTSYAFNGKIMLISVVVLLVVCIIIIFFHIYARLFHRHRLHQAQPKAHHKGGLEPSVLKSLPTFIYVSKAHNDPPAECAVCLSDLENGETGRVLPKCNHSFHIDCIDLWLQSHSDCPLCRALVRPIKNIPFQASGNMFQNVVSISNPTRSESVSNYRLCSTCRMEENQTCSSSSTHENYQAKSALIGITMEVPEVDPGLRSSNEMGLGSDGCNGFKSLGAPVR